MIYLKHDNYYDNVTIPIKSDAYINGTPDFIKTDKNYIAKLASIHRVIYTSQYIPNIDDVFYAKIDTNYLNELVCLHREWFPMNYDKDYFKKFLLKSSYYNLGAYINLGGHSYLIGCVLGEVCSENRFRNNVKGILRKKKWHQMLFTPKDKCGYLNTIGVIDEFRKMQIGTTLIKQFIDDMSKRNCIALFLHTIEHNLSSINFYEKNKWNHGGVIPKYYCINNTHFEAEVFYMILQSNEEFKKVPIEGEQNQGQGPFKEINTKGCCKSLWLKINKFIP